MDATVDIRLTRRLAELPLHKALESGLTTQDLGLWMAFRGMHPQDALHIVKQESHRYTYGNERADTQAKHQSTSHTPGARTRTTGDPTPQPPAAPTPIPSATQPPQWIPEDTPYTDRDKQYHYLTPIQQLATTLTYDFTGQNVTFLKKYPKKNLTLRWHVFWIQRTQKGGGVLMKTFSKGSFTRFFQKKWPRGGGRFTRFHQTWH